MTQMSSNVASAVDIAGLPDFIVIGAQKCGTSSLHFYLDSHPDIRMSVEKELQFFSRDDRWSRGVAWYRERLAAGGKPGAALIGESSPQYTWYPFGPDVPQRMHSLLPDAKLIYIVRDPIERLLSQYMDWIHLFWEDRDIEAALSDVTTRPNRYIEPGCYRTQLDRYLQYYPAENILVLTLEELSGDPDTTMARVYAFIGADPAFRSPALNETRNPQAGKRKPNALFRALMTERLRFELLEPRRLPVWAAKALKRVINLTGQRLERPQLLPATAARLKAIYRDEVAGLEAFCGGSFPGWHDYTATNPDR